MIEQRVTDIARAIAARQPALFRERIEYWSQGPSNAVWQEMVKSSRGAPMPAFDRYHREVQQDRRAYEDCWDDIERLIGTIVGLEAKYLIAIHVASKTESQLALDTGRECQACRRPVANTPADPIRSGFCDACRKAWDRAGKPDRVLFIKERREGLGILEEAS